MKRTKAHAILTALAGITAIAAPSAANAAGLADIFENLTEVIGPGVILLSAACYLGGAGLVAWAFFSFRSLGGQQARQEPGKFAQILAAAVAGFALIYLPTTIETGGETVFGTDTQTQGEGGNLDLD